MTVAAGAKSPVRILFLISDTGGGHRASAQALSSAFQTLYGSAFDVQCTVLDFYTEVIGRPFRRMPEQYQFLQKHPALWKFAWAYGKFPVTRRITEEFSNVIGNSAFRSLLDELSPHIIVSVHPLTQFIPLRVLRQTGLDIPFVTVCTDLAGAHPTWFHPAVDLCFIPSPQIQAIARKCGLKDEQLKMLGLPVRQSFYNQSLLFHSNTHKQKSYTRQLLNMRTDSKVVLVVGGGDGVGGIEKIFHSIVHKFQRSPVASPEGLDQHVTVVVVCGRNQKARKRLLEEMPDLEAANPNVSVVVNGFVNNMSEWMLASDMLISKAGPGTIAESLICGLPIILSGFLPGQEWPNVDFVINSGVGDFNRKPHDIADTVHDWVSNPEELEKRAKLAKQLGRPNATFDIVREIGKLIGLEPSDTSPGSSSGGDHGELVTRRTGANDLRNFSSERNC